MDTRPECTGTSTSTFSSGGPQPSEAGLHQRIVRKSTGRWTAPGMTLEVTVMW